jgi:large subunit ribosomal protein L10
MSMLKTQKMELVKRLEKELKSHKTIAILPTEGLPDRLLQKVRNQLKGRADLVIARKTLLARALKESGFGKLESHINGNVALILSNEDPMEIYKVVRSNRLQLAAKPNQISPEDISIEAGDTSIAPGQTVTDLKAGGIDVKIDKGKVVISKGKVLVAKGAKISGAVANALKILDIKPFAVSPKLKLAISGGLLFNEAALGMDEEFVVREAANSFRAAYAISLEIGLVTKYNADALMARGYRNAIAVGMEAKIPEPEITKMLLAKAAAQASEVSSESGAESQS